MSPLRRPSVRWAVPVAAFAAIVGAASVSRLVPAGAQVPNLPPLTAAELLVKVTTAQIPPMSGTIRLTANLGLPDLGGFAGSIPGSLTELLVGSHSARIATDGPTKLRVTMEAQNTESSWIRNGADVWSWDSTTQTATHATIAADTPDKTVATDATKPSEPVLTPAAEAAKMLAQVDPSTTVSVRTSAYVAGRAAYELVLVPKSAASTVSEVVLSVDAATGVALDARITAKGATKPAIEIGFTDVSFATPEASNFTFTPPAGATVKQVASVSDLVPLSNGRHHHDRADAPSTGSAASNTDPSTKPADATTADNNGANNTVGTGWDSVMIIKGGGVTPQISGLLGRGSSITLPGGHTGHLISTALVNGVITDDGRVAVGAVNSNTLVAALAA